MVPRHGFRCMFMLFAVLSSWAAAASENKPAFVIGEKLSDSVGFYDVDGKRLSGAKVGWHPHEVVFSPDKRTLYVADDGVVWITENSIRLLSAGVV
jgi:DNA-binding beta-propeller fold protein YncE